MQFLAAIALAVWAGLFADRKLNTGFPLAVWLLPLLVIGITIYKIIQDTGRR
jgi:hypothetical protein